MRDRAYRRAQWERIKKRVKEHWPWLEDILVSRNATHHHTCWMCGHRRFWDGPTRQERINCLDWQDYNDGERW